MKMAARPPPVGPLMPWKTLSRMMTLLTPMKSMPAM